MFAAYGYPTSYPDPPSAQLHSYGSPLFWPQDASFTTPMESPTGSLGSSRLSSSHSLSSSQLMQPEGLSGFYTPYGAMPSSRFGLIPAAAPALGSQPPTPKDRVLRSPSGSPTFAPPTPASRPSGLAAVPPVSLERLSGNKQASPTQTQSGTLAGRSPKPPTVTPAAPAPAVRPAPQGPPGAADLPPALRLQDLHRRRPEAGVAVVASPQEPPPVIPIITPSSPRAAAPPPPLLALHKVLLPTSGWKLPAARPPSIIAAEKRTPRSPKARRRVSVVIPEATLEVKPAVEGTLSAALCAKWGVGAGTHRRTTPPKADGAAEGVRPHSPRDTTGDESALSSCSCSDAEEDMIGRHLHAGASMVFEAPRDPSPYSPKPSKAVRLEDFELLKVLGKGAFGKAWKVRRKGTRQLYAMKVMAKRLFTKQNLVHLLNGEKEIMANVRHPFIATLRWAWQTEDRAFLVMDYLPGGELGKHLAVSPGRKFTEYRAKYYAAQITLAYEYLHSKNIMYRDMKLDNVLLDEEGNAVLIDFGLAEGLQPEGRDKGGRYFGLPNYYLSPEMIRGQPFGLEADWWMFGVVVYQMLTGTLPWMGPNPREVHTQIISDSPTPLQLPPDCSPDVADFLRRLLTKDLAHRLCTAAAVKAHPWFSRVPWDRLLAREIPTPYKPPPEETEEGEGAVQQAMSWCRPPTHRVLLRDFSYCEGRDGGDDDAAPRPGAARRRLASIGSIASTVSTEDDGEEEEEP
eukprot:EG_transcript_2427